MQFCPKCNNILDISRSVPKSGTILDNETPATVSTTEPKIDKLLDKIINDENVEDELKSVDMVTIQKNPKFNNLNAKQKKQIQNKLNEFNDKAQDDNIIAYRICRNCTYNEPIQNNTLIMSRINKGATTGYTNIEKYKNMVHNKTLPRTRQYICPNEHCDSKNNYDKREAVFFRPNINSYELWYTCVACQTYWRAI